MLLKVNAQVGRLLELLERASDRAPELLGAVGLICLGVSVLADGLLKVLAVGVAFVAALALAGLPLLKERLARLRQRAVLWYLTRS